MATKKAKRLTTEAPEALRDEWLNRLRALTETIKTWAEGADWSTRVITKPMKDSVLGEYKAPALLLQRETTRALLDPIAPFTPGSEGIVDLYLMPAYDDVAHLYFIEGEWWMDRDVDFRRVLEEKPRPVRVTKEALLVTLDEMTTHAA